MISFVQTLKKILDLPLWDFRSHNNSGLFVLLCWTTACVEEIMLHHWWNYSSPATELEKCFVIYNMQQLPILKDVRKLMWLQLKMAPGSVFYTNVSLLRCRDYRNKKNKIILYRKWKENLRQSSQYCIVVRKCNVQKSMAN